VEDFGAHAQGFGEAGAPLGMIMNSWMSIGASECAPPFMMFIMGTGSTLALAAEVAEEGQAEFDGGGVRHGHGNAQHGVGAELGLGLGAVELRIFRRSMPAWSNASDPSSSRMGR
jgi:hypothetical protein